MVHTVPKLFAETIVTFTFFIVSRSLTIIFYCKMLHAHCSEREPGLRVYMNRFLRRIFVPKTMRMGSGESFKIRKFILYLK